MKKAISFLSILIIALCTLLFFNGDLAEELLENPLSLDEIVLFADDTNRIEDDSYLDYTVQKQNSDDLTTENKQSGQKQLLEGNNYAYSCLTADEKVIYNEILSSIENCEKESDLSTIDVDLIDKAFNCVMFDHPELFYVQGYQYTEYSLLGKLDKITFSGTYPYGKKEIKKRQKIIDSVVDEMLADAPSCSDEYELVKYAYDTIIEHTEYDLSAVDNQNICSVFMNGRSVCQGYAKAFQYLLSKMDIMAPVVIGKVRDGEGHAWNLVRMNGRYYYVDVTWGDASFMLIGEEDGNFTQNNKINYDYLGVTTEQISRTHYIDMPIEMPECNSVEDNYYVRNDSYFYAYDEKRIQSLFEKAYQNGEETLTIKCNDDAVYEEIRAQLISFQKIFDFLHSKGGTIAYTNDDKQRTLTFWL